MEDPYPVENIDRLGVLMFQTSDNSQLLRRVLWINAELTIVWSLKHKNTQPSYIFNRENPQNSEPQNGPRRRLDFIALDVADLGPVSAAVDPPKKRQYLHTNLLSKTNQDFGHCPMVWEKYTSDRGALCNIIPKVQTQSCWEKDFGHSPSYIKRN